MMMAMLQAGGMGVVSEPPDPEAIGLYEHPRAISGTWTDADLAAWDGKAVKILGALPSLPESLDLRLIVMRRNLDRVLASGKVIAERRGTPFNVSKAYHQSSIDAIRLWAARYHHIEVWYDDVLRDTAHQCLRVLLCLHPEYDRNDPPPMDLVAMAAVVDPSKRHHA